MKETEEERKRKGKKNIREEKNQKENPTGKMRCAPEAAVERFTRRDERKEKVEERNKRIEKGNY